MTPPKNHAPRPARAWRGALWACLLAAVPTVWVVPAWGQSLADPFATRTDIPPTPAKDLLRSIDAARDCQLASPTGIVDLLTATAHALCSNPKTRQAWVDVQIKAAQVGTAASAYLPTLNATLRSAADRTATDVPSQPDLSSAQRSAFREYTLSLSWNLLDFGTRAAEAEAARQALLAAQSAHDDVLQTVFATTVKDYYAAVAARSALEAAIGTEDDARRSLQAATARVLGGIAAVSDQLQAQTDYAQATFNRAKASGDARTLLGVLAVDMGLRPNRPFQLPPMSEEVAPDTGLDRSIDHLIDQARQFHPKTTEARAQLQAAIAKADSVQAQGLPNLALSARATNSTQPVVPAVGMAALPASAQDRYVGIQLNVPIFEGYARTYASTAAAAAIEVQRANLHDIEQQVTLNVWTTYIALETGAENLRNTAVLLDSAQKSYVAAGQRYAKGVGSIVELLSAQSALASARQRRVQALLDWRAARLQLAASLGRLNVLKLQ